MKNIKLLGGFMLLLLMSSCSITNKSMKTPNYHVEFYKTDFEYSEQVMASATSVRVLGIDWKRIFKWDVGMLESDRFYEIPQQIEINSNVVANPVVGAVSAIIPVMGDYGKGKVSNYALHQLMVDNPGYDLVIYPQYEMHKFWIPIFYSKTTVEVRARLGKIK